MLSQITYTYYMLDMLNTIQEGTRTCGDITINNRNL